MVFWRCLAYLAAFHFVRQQYGFMMLYGRRERQRRWIDQAAIYAATLYPLAWWHLHPRHFDWFIAGDFFTFRRRCVADAAACGLSPRSWPPISAKEAALVWRTRQLNWPRNLLLAQHRAVLVDRHHRAGQRPRLHRRQRLGAWRALHGADLAVR